MSNVVNKYLFVIIFILYIISQEIWIHNILQLCEYTYHRMQMWATFRDLVDFFFIPPKPDHCPKLCVVILCKIRAGPHYFEHPQFWKHPNIRVSEMHFKELTFVVMTTCRMFYICTRFANYLCNWISRTTSFILSKYRKYHELILSWRMYKLYPIVSLQSLFNLAWPNICYQSST